MRCTGAPSNGRLVSASSKIKSAPPISPLPQTPPRLLLRSPNQIPNSAPPRARRRKQIAAMEADPAPSSTPPPSSPAPAASPSRHPPGEEGGGAERVEVEEYVDPPSPDCCGGADPDHAPPPSPKGEEPVVSAEEEQAAVAGGEGEALRSFLEEFGDQGDDSLIPSPKLKQINTPDRLAALRFLGGKYNSLLERYKQQVAKCAEECAPRYDGLKKKYADECAERRRLYNELIELRGNIRVFCRCRPLSTAEISNGCSSIVQIDPSHETELQFVPSDKDRKAFKFDHVFGPSDNQETVFAESLPVVRSVMDGFNVCIFAYGQTGTGKTFTMEGIPEDRGVNYRALEELFRLSEERSSSVAYTFAVSILEVYNEKIRDLLDESSEQTGRKLDIKQTADGTQEVAGLIEAPIYTIDGVWEKLKVGAKNRSVGATSANELSSRSHSLVKVTVRSEHLVTGQKWRSHIWLVDLAGSERVNKTEVEGDRLKESQFINKSLSALGDVISALASKNAHIPYRNSKLTHLLQSSLGGDCKTLMFVQISPSSADSGETLCSLNFASRVRAIDHGPARKQADPAETFKLKQMTEKIRHEEKENAKLLESLQVTQLKYASRENVIKTLQEKIREAEQTSKTYQQRVRELENELANEKKAARDTARSTKPPLAPMRQRPPLGRIGNHIPPKAPLRLRLSKAPTIQNKENIPVMMNKGSSGADTSKAVAGKARRVSLTPVIRHIPLQPKRRSSLAVLPTQREQLSIFPDKRSVSRLSHIQMPRRSIATFNSIPATPLAAAAHKQVDGTPEARQLRRIEFSSSKFRSPPALARFNSRNNALSPQQKLRLASGSGNASKICFSVQKRVILGSPAPVKSSLLSGTGIFNPALREKMMAAKIGNAQRVFNTNRRKSVL
uniref:Kinesin-like protein n=1 Tax=Oryza barthii TaxID=65489 RepID=A0A0D3G7C5_9ORYZ